MPSTILFLQILYCLIAQCKAHLSDFVCHLCVNTYVLDWQVIWYKYPRLPQFINCNHFSDTMIFHLVSVSGSISNSVTLVYGDTHKTNGNRQYRGSRSSPSQHHYCALHNRHSVLRSQGHLSKVKTCQLGLRYKPSGGRAVLLDTHTHRHTESPC